MAKYKYIHCDIFKRGVAVFIGDCESLRKWAKRFYNRPDEQDLITQINEYCTEEKYVNKDIAACTYDSECSGHQLVHLPIFSFKYEPSEISNLEHELLHCTFNILDYLGVEYRYGGSNETYTYLNEYLLKNALIEKGYKEVK